MLKRIKDGLTDLAPEVAEALGEGRAVVALEFDDHHAWHALSAERRDGEGGRGDGAGGGRCAGDDRDHRRADQGRPAGATSSKGSAARSTSSRRPAATLPPRSWKHANAGTTVAATMAIAARAGIEVFATGGIGGVHRGAEQTFDISADLTELAASPVAVVCAGCKSILDIAKTLEFLETQGVPVVGYGTDEFPAFFARSSGHKLDHRFDSAADVAAMIRMERKLGSRSGILIANPIPEEHALPAAEIEERIAAAVKDAEQRRHRSEGSHALSAEAHQRADRRKKPHREHRADQEQRARGCRDRGRAGRTSGRRLTNHPMPVVLVIGDVMTDIVAKPDGPIAVGADRRATIRALAGRGRREPGLLAGAGRRRRPASSRGSGTRITRGRPPISRPMESMRGSART